jgi:hypothetical protein
MNRDESSRRRSLSYNDAPIPRAHSEAIQAMESFFNYTPPTTKDAVEAMEVDVRHTRKRTRM